MNIFTNILALCVAQSSIWGLTAFTIQNPNTRSVVLKSAPGGQPISEGGRVVNGGGFGASTPQPVKQVPATISTLLPPVKNIWETSDPIVVQGGTLRTWSTPTAQRIQLSMNSEGRPMNANIELWQGPDNTPQKLTIYIEDGDMRPFNAVIETPRGPNSIALYNTGQLEYPFDACVEPDVDTIASDSDALNKGLKIVQGGALKTWPFESAVASVQVYIKTDGRPLNSRIELLQGPNNQKQVIDIYTEDGMERPFFGVIETPGTGNVIRVLNTAPMEYPMHASVEPYVIVDQEVSSGWSS